MKTKVKNTKFPTQKTSKGITLVALVITIIVLLILAGVAINMAINSDGLFGKASEATEKWNTAVENERSEIQNVLNVLGVKAPTNFPKEWDSDKVADMVTEKVTINEEEITRNAPIPVGFVASQIPTEDTISEGLVIYEGKDPVTGNANSAEHLAAMTSRNQYVWIPVDDVNYMVMCKLNNANSDKTVCELVLDNGELRCKTHNPTGENTTDLCGRLYEGGSTQTTKVDGKSVYTYIQTINESAWKTQKYDGLWKEPAIVTGDNGDTYDGVDSYLNNIGLVAKDGKTAQQVFLEQLTSDFSIMATSVAKYGGFYISRYEAGENGASLKNQKVLIAGTAVTSTLYDSTTWVNAGMWYGIYNTLRRSTAVASTHMIWRKPI